MTDAQLAQLVSDIVVKVLVALALAAVSYATTHWAWLQRTQAELSANTLLGTLARTAVGAAEQSLAGAPGSEKKHQALDWMTMQAEAHGIKATPAMVSRMAGLIEANVHEIHQTEALTAPPAVVVNTVPPAVVAKSPPGPPAVVTTLPDPIAGAAATPEARVAAGRQKGESA